MDKETLGSVFIITLLLCIGAFISFVITATHTRNKLSYPQIKSITENVERLCASNGGPNKVNLDIGSYTIYCNNGAKFEDVTILSTEQLKKNEQMEPNNATKTSN